MAAAAFLSSGTLSVPTFVSKLLNSKTSFKEKNVELQPGKYFGCSLYFLAAIAQIRTVTI